MKFSNSSPIFLKKIWLKLLKNSLNILSLKPFNILISVHENTILSYCSVLHIFQLLSRSQIRLYCLNDPLNLLQFPNIRHFPYYILPETKPCYISLTLLKSLHIPSISLKISSYSIAHCVQKLLRSWPYCNSLKITSNFA